MGLTPRNRRVIGAGAGGIAMGIQLAAGPDTTSRSLTAPMDSAGPGATTRSRARPATSRRICTRTRSRSTRGGARPTRTSPRSWPISRRWPPITGWRTPAAEHHGRHRALVGRRAALDPDHRRRRRARLRHRGQRGRDARCALHPRYPWGGAVSGPAIPFVALGSQQIDGGGAGGVHRYRRQRDPIRSRDRPKNRAAHRVSANPDLDRAAIRLSVHPRAARAVRTRPRRGAKAARRSLRRLRVLRLRRRRRDRPAKRPSWPAVT